MNFGQFQDWAMTPGGIAVWLTVLCGLIFGSLLLGADRKIRLGRDAALIALLAAVASASRVLFAAIPNVQPVTLLILMIGIHLGARRALDALGGRARLCSSPASRGPRAIQSASRSVEGGRRACGDAAGRRPGAIARIARSGQSKDHSGRCTSLRCEQQRSFTRAHHQDPRKYVTPR